MNSKKILIYYKRIEYEETFEKNDLMINILKKFSKIHEIEKHCFIINGKEISFNFLENGRIKADMYNGKKIIALNLKSEKNWKLENVLCPECKNLAFITYNLNEETICLECKKCNKKNNYSISQFMDIQLDSSNIKCDECKSIRNIYDSSKELYICSDCYKKEEKDDKKEDKKKDKKLKIKLCSACKAKHQENEKHKNNYNYNLKYEYCIKYGMPLKYYCNTCNCNFSEKEENSHEKHNYFELKKKKPSKNKIDEIQKKIKELNDNIEKYRKELDVLKIIFDGMIFNMKKNLDNHLKLNDYLGKISENLDNLNNYQKIKNLDGFVYNKIINNIKSFLDYKIKDKFKYLIEKLYSKNIPYNQIELSYTPNPLSTIKLFNEEFVNQNKEKCYLILLDKIMELCQFYEYKKKFDSEFKINFISLEPITDMKNMFYDCDLLDSFVSYNFDTSKVSDMSNMFRRCLNLIDVKGIKDTSNVTNMSNMFRDCKNLTYINNISNWNLSKVKDLSYMFYKCSNLPNISEYLLWDTSNVTNMSHLFDECSSFEQIPEISSWNTNNVVYMNDIFNSCRNIKSLPDLSKWSIRNLTNMGNMFEGCVHLEELPDISHWDTSNVTNMSGFLNQCETLKSLPDFSNWNTSKVTNMKEMFYYCKSLKKFPNISSWCTSKVNDISFMFCQCKDLENIPDRTLFKKNIIDKKYDYDTINFNDIKRKRTMVNKPSKKLANEDIDDIALRKAFTGKEKEITQSKK